MEAFSTILSFTILITTSLISLMFSNVSFVVLFLTLLAGEKIAIGGFALNILKKLNGLTLLIPFESIVLANAIGLGPTLERRYLCKSFVAILFGSISKFIIAQILNKDLTNLYNNNHFE